LAFETPPSQAFEVAPAQPLPETLRDGRYAVHRLLSEGAQATTYDAVDKLRGAAVIVKQFRIRGADWKRVELFEREIRVLSGLRHGALPSYVDHFEEDGCLYLVMDRLGGESLLALRTKGRRFQQRDVVRFLREAADVLDYLHGHAPPIIHRDLKPSNVLERPDGSFAFVDFGSVRDGLKPDGGSTVVGTFGYMAPEQFQGRALPASDVYAVGATAVWMASGVEPERLPHRGLRIDVRAALAGQIEPALLAVLEQLLEPDPDQRPRRIAALLDPPPAAQARPPRSKAPDPSRPGGRAAGSPWYPVLMLLVLTALLTARVATWALFELALPALLMALSLVFGQRLRRGAARLKWIGRRGGAALHHAAQMFQDRMRRRPRRYRVVGEHQRPHRHRSTVADPFEWQPPRAHRHRR